MVQNHASPSLFLSAHSTISISHFPSPNPLIPTLASSPAIRRCSRCHSQISPFVFKLTPRHSKLQSFDTFTSGNLHYLLVLSDLLGRLHGPAVVVSEIWLQPSYRCALFSKWNNHIMRNNTEMVHAVNELSGTAETEMWCYIVERD